MRPRMAPKCLPGGAQIAPKSFQNGSRRPPESGTPFLTPFCRLLGGSWGAPGALLAFPGAVLAPLGALLGASGEPLGPSKTLPNRSRRLSRRPPAPELDFGSILGVILAPFWDPSDLKKQGFRMEGVAFFEKSRSSKKTAQKHKSDDPPL